MALFCVVIEKAGWPWQPAFDSLSTSLPPTRAGSRRTWAREGWASRRRLRPIWYENDEHADRRKQSDTVKVEGHLELTGEAAKATARSAWVRRRTGTGGARARRTPCAEVQTRQQRTRRRSDGRATRQVSDARRGIGRAEIRQERWCENCWRALMFWTT
jgi:hypothetical protein